MAAWALAGMADAAVYVLDSAKTAGAAALGASAVWEAVPGALVVWWEAAPEVSVVWEAARAGFAVWKSSANKHCKCRRAAAIGIGKFDQT